jgi:hypothetical protein
MASPAVRLQLINRSNDQNNSKVVIFQRNPNPSPQEMAVAWQVIQNLGPGSRHPFRYTIDAEIGGSDSYGNFTPLLPAPAGTAFEMAASPAGDILRQTDQPATDPQNIELTNSLPEGAISALIYRSGKLAATKTNIFPGQKVVFQFKPSIWVGVVSEVVEGDTLNSAIVSAINTEFMLVGIASADIIWSGGGEGAEAKPFIFTLENVRFGAPGDSAEEDEDAATEEPE